ncbi:MAG TPA: hypothetical protein PLA59_05095 [Myxococcota bacterium]|jgi:hypothetical protein|nr:hypothetical protein [Oligoflexales bacterium]HON26225.1 hypothetical protein [Myxococcota bacterium]HOS61766.1 hypothetical protein [Myxococcota bacterium]HPC92553.1 hypothetical protein [Myxococcota bacterium]HQL57985.1 hypothetical protein [Myxococcota bacterium]
MKKTFLAIGSALLLALTFAACDMGENEPEANPTATTACKAYRTDLGNAYMEICEQFGSEAEFLQWFQEANCEEAKWNVELTDQQTTNFDACLVGISRLSKDDCARLFGDTPVYIDEIVPSCDLWWPDV